MAQRHSVHGLNLPAELVSEHGVLLQSASTLIDHLLSLYGRLVPGRVADHRHSVFARRALTLGDLLEATLHLCIQRKYSASFVVLRAALEHHLIDQLLFLGRRYEQVLENVEDEQWAAMKAARQEGSSWSDVVRWQRTRRGKVTAIRSGPHLKGGKVGPRAPTLSIYYMVLEEYSPFQGRLKAQKHFVRSFTDPRTHRKIALRTRSIWEEYLSWEAIKRNLVINRFYGSRQVSQLDVHYGFLSAYAHPNSHEAVELIQGHDFLAGLPSYDHFASELVLLYISTFASRELRCFQRMASRTPRVRLSGWSEVLHDIRLGEEAASHLWWPGGRPHWYDRVEEANHRGLRGRRLVPRNERLPQSIPDSSIKYYRNPLRRLIRMHRSHEELTGFSYVAPWERPDPLIRW